MELISSCTQITPFTRCALVLSIQVKLNLSVHVHIKCYALVSLLLWYLVNAAWLCSVHRIHGRANCCYTYENCYRKNKPFQSLLQLNWFKCVCSECDTESMGHCCSLCLCTRRPYITLGTLFLWKSSVLLLVVVVLWLLFSFITFVYIVILWVFAFPLKLVHRIYNFRIEFQRFFCLHANRLLCFILFVQCFLFRRFIYILFTFWINAMIESKQKQQQQQKWKIVV